MRNLRAYLPAVILLVGCGFIWNMRSQAAVPLAAPLKNILASYPGYRFKDMTLSDEERRVLGNTDYIARLYERDSIPQFTRFVSHYERQTEGKNINSMKHLLTGGTR